MPYFKYRGKRKYEYELANGLFTPDDFDPDVRCVFEALHEMGVQLVYCRYHGGGDEGYAELSSVKLNEATIEFDDLKQQLAECSLGRHSSENMLRYYAWNNRPNPSPELRVEFFLERFATSLAIFLLGRGFGTGEYSMKGSFSANLETGELIDEQKR